MPERREAAKSFFMHLTVYGRAVATVSSNRGLVTAEMRRTDNPGKKNAPSFRALEGRRGRNLKKRRGRGMNDVRAAWRADFKVDAARYR
jgi:hypothetical protein